MQQIPQKPSVVHQVSTAEPVKPEVEQIEEQPIIEVTKPEEAAAIEHQQQNILEMSEKLQEFQTLDNKVSQEYLHQKLNDVANNDNTIER
jgi:hypothetical protein